MKFESRILPACARRPLAVGLALALSWSAATPARNATAAHAPREALQVSNCDDDGAGSLRAAVAAAVSGDTIDFAALGCSTITLTTGYIAVAQDDLAIEGPGAGSLTIDAAYASGVMRHTGAGTLSISGLTLANGTHTTDTEASLGGCLYSAANLEVVDSVVTACTAHGTNVNDAFGGAIYAYGNLVLRSAVVSGSRAYASAVAYGGGVFVHGDLDAQTSAFNYNGAQGVPVLNSHGGGAIVHGATRLDATTFYYNSAYEVGGLWTYGPVTIENSLFAHNGAKLVAGMRAEDGGSAPTATIANSTFAYNISHERIGALSMLISATITNTTIAKNDAFGGFGGVFFGGDSLELESTIIATNTEGGTPSDLTVYGSPTITGANNLVIETSATLPPDTITDDPLLDVLADNGGPTLAMALLPGSPAIDAGNNVAALATDQRGAGFARHVGRRTDIGAFEVQDADFVFSDGFDAD
ncbi:MAG: choice-of-anchor Q domain-containing protein [Rhodanobacteraceae bacterium]